MAAKDNNGDGKKAGGGSVGVGVDEEAESPGLTDLPPLPVLAGRTLGPPAVGGGVGASTSFQPLSHTASRRSNTSSRTFADSAMLVGALPNLSREETRISRIGTGYVADIIRQHDPLHEHEEEEEAGRRRHSDVADKYEVVAVQVTPDGQELTFPDGGREAWLCLFGGSCALFCGFGLVGAAGAYQTYYENHLLSQYPSGTIAWIGSVTAFVSLGLAAFTGSLFDMYGHKPLIGTGTFILVLSFCLLSLCTQFYQVILCHALSGIGNNLLFICPLGVVGQWFARRRGLAFGLLTSGASVGASVWPIIWANLPPKIGFAWTMRLIALMCGILGTVAFFLMKTRLPPKPPGPFFHLKAFKSVVYICLCIGASSWAFGFFTSLTFVGTYGRLLELGDVTPYLLVTVNGASGVGRFLTAFIADRVGAYNATIVANLAMVVLFWCWLAAKTGTALIIINILYGIASGAFVSLQAPMITRLADDMRFAGTMVGQVLMFQSFAQLIGPPIAGALFGDGSREEQLHNFPRLIILGSMMLTVATGVTILARLKLDRNIWAVM